MALSPFTLNRILSTQRSPIRSKPSTPNPDVFQGESDLRRHAREPELREPSGASGFRLLAWISYYLIWVVVKIRVPFLGTLNIRSRTILRTQEGTPILTTTLLFRLY